MEGGVLEELLNATDGDGEGARAKAERPLGLAVALFLGLVMPAALALAVVLPVLIILPTHAANEKLGSFNEVKQFYLYLGISAIYGLVVGVRQLVLHLAS